MRVATTDRKGVARAFRHMAQNATTQQLRELGTSRHSLVGIADMLDALPPEQEAGTRAQPGKAGTDI
jgi:hypothetical protein